MKCLFKIKLIVLVFLLSKNVLAQSSIKVHVIDKKLHTPISKVHVKLFEMNRKIRGLDTDTNGFVKFESIDTNFYDVKANYAGYCTFTFKEIKVYPNKTTLVEIEMTTKSDCRKNRKRKTIYNLP